MDRAMALGPHLQHELWCEEHMLHHIDEFVLYVTTLDGVEEARAMLCDMTEEES